jgi:serine protease
LRRHPFPLRLSATIAVAVAAAFSLALAPAASARLLARAAFVPNDTGVASAGGPVAGWQSVQWALTGPFGINTPQAWEQVSSAGGSGGRGVTIAVLDSGVAYADRGRFRRSPDLSRTRFVRGRDFVDNDPYPNDEFGHGTFVASTIAATANNAYGTVGVAYRATIMPVRVLDSEGRGFPRVIARAIRYAVDRRVDVINLSLELYDAPPNAPVPRSVTASRSVREALAAARRAGVLVVSAVGNSYDARVPNARYDTLSLDVGGTTEHGCLGNYSNHGPGMDVVAPGGGEDAALPGNPNCTPEAAPGRDISAVSFPAGRPRSFQIVPRFRGTSTAAPHVSGLAALVIASRVLGRDPSPAAIERHVERTARDLGAPGRDPFYGAGLVDATAATAAPVVTSSG